jgi:hypothetical protein
MKMVGAGWKCDRRSLLLDSICAAPVRVAKVAGEASDGGCPRAPSIPPRAGEFLHVLSSAAAFFYSFCEEKDSSNLHLTQEAPSKNLVNFCIRGEK